MNKFDPTKPCTTRDGKEVKIYAVYPGQKWEIHGAVKNENGVWQSVAWDKRGRYNEYDLPSTLDLMNITETHEAWVNVYPASIDLFGSELHKSKEAADLRANNHIRTACIKVTWEDGEGL